VEIVPVSFLDASLRLRPVLYAAGRDVAIEAVGGKGQVFGIPLQGPGFRVLWPFNELKLRIYVSIYVFIYLLYDLFVLLFIYLFICLFVYLFNLIYPSSRLPF
jgi:hypothetical protein